MKNMREFLTAVINAEVSEELTAFATAEIDKMNAKNENRRNTQTKAQKENAALLNAIVEAMKNGENELSETVTASQIATAYEISTQKASALLQSGVKNEVLTVGEIKGKSGKVKAYTVVL